MVLTRTFVVFAFSVILSLHGLAQTDSKSFVFQEGDFLFQDLDCGDLCTAIETVTEGVDGKSFSHVGLVVVRNDTSFVIEAIGKEVQLTPIFDFIGRNSDESGNPKILVSRLKSEYLYLKAPVLRFALDKLGVPYDDAFIYDNGIYYCSELIYDAFMAANGDVPFFQLEPMTFKDPKTGKMFPVWGDYYDQLGMEIPEGELGCNPGGISRSDKLQVVASFY